MRRFWTAASTRPGRAKIHSEREIPPVGELDWKSSAVLVAHNLRAALLRHPNVASHIGVTHIDPQSSPAAARLFDAAIASAISAGFSDDGLRRAIHLTMMVALGWAILEARREEGEPLEGDEEQDADSTELDYASFLDLDMDEQFELVIQITLEGIERRWLGSAASET